MEKCKQKEEAQVYVDDLGLFVTLQLLEDTPAGLSLGKLCEEHGYSYEWVSGQQPRVTKKSVQNEQFRTSCCSISGTSSSSTSILQDSSLSGPASDRSDEHAPGNLRDTDEIIQNQNKKRDDSGDPDVRLRDLSERMKEFIDHLEDTELPPSAHVSQDSDSERPTNVISKSRKHLYFYWLPKRPKFRSMFANDNYEDSLQKTHWRSSTSSRKVGDLMTV